MGFSEARREHLPGRELVHGSTWGMAPSLSQAPFAEVWSVTGLCMGKVGGLGLTTVFSVCFPNLILPPPSPLLPSVTPILLVLRQSGCHPEALCSLCPVSAQWSASGRGDPGFCSGPLWSQSRWAWRSLCSRHSDALLFLSLLVWPPPVLLQAPA